MKLKEELRELMTGVDRREAVWTNRQRAARAKREVRMAADVSAVFQLIPESDDDWITAGQIALRLTDETGVMWTVERVYAAVAELKDQFPDMPLISKPVKGYRFSTDPDAVTEMRNWVIRQAITKITRLWTGTVLPWLESQGDPDKAEDVKLSFERLVQDLGRIQPKR